MREVGFLESRTGNVGDLMRALGKESGELIMASQDDRIANIIAQLSEAGVSQLPVKDENGWIKGIVREHVILKALFNQQVNVDDSVESLIDTAVEYVDPEDSIERISKL